MDGTREYKIVINGVEESINAVEALKKRLDELDAKIKTLESRSINVNGNISVDTNTNATKKSSVGTLTEEIALEKELNAIKNEGTKLEAKSIAYETESYQRLLAQKDTLKEIVADQKQIAAQERLQANTYNTQTMAGMKQKLADIKAVMQTTDVASDKFKELTAEANNLNAQLLEIEKSYGTFSRQVGNYTVGDGLNKLSIEVGAVTREFNNARDASKTLKNELYALEASGKGNTVSAKNLRNAIYNLNSMMKDAAVSSKAMDSAMDWMQSITSISLVNKGFSSFFGFDKGEITKGIQDLVALQSVLQGVEQIRKQMETKEGIGKLLGNGFDKIDSWTFSLKRHLVEVKGITTATKAWATAINLVGKAMKGIMSLGIYAAINLLQEGISLAITSVKEWAKGNADLVTEEKQLKNALDAVNYTLQERLRLNQALERAQKLTQASREIEDEKAYADAIAETNRLLKERALYDSNNKTFYESMQGGSSYASKFLNFDTGVTSIGGFTEATHSMDELLKRYKLLEQYINSNGMIDLGKDFESFGFTVSDAKDELNHLQQFLAGQMVSAMQKFDLSTEQGRQGLEQFVNGILQGDDDIKKSILLNLGDYVSNGEGKLSDALKRYVDLIKNFVQMANAETKKLKFDEMVENILDSADESGKRVTDRRKKELTDRYNTLNDAQKILEKKRYNEAMQALDKMQAKRNLKLSVDYKKTLKKTEEYEAELNKMRIAAMNEGLNKTMKTLDEERRLRDEKIKIEYTNEEKRKKLLEASEKQYEKQKEDALKKHNADMLAMQEDYNSTLLEETARGQELDLDQYELYLEKRKALYEQYNVDNYVNGASYAVPPQSTFKKETRKTLYKSNDEEYLNSQRIGEDELEMAKSLKEREQAYRTAENRLAAYNAKILNIAKEYAVAKERIDQQMAFTESDEERARLEARKASITKAYEIEQEFFKGKWELFNHDKEVTKTAFEAEKEAYEVKYGSLEQSRAIDLLNEENYTKSIALQFKERMSSVNRYWQEYISVMQSSEADILEIQNKEKELAKTRRDQDLADAEKNYRDNLTKQTEYYKQRLEEIEYAKDKELITEKGYEDEKALALEEYEKNVTALQTLHNDNSEKVEAVYQEELSRINREGIEERKAMYTEYFQDTLNELTKFENAVSQVEAKQPVKNIWGFTNWKQTNRNNQELLDSYVALLEQITNKRNELNSLFKKGLIDKDVYSTTLSDLDAFSASLGIKIDDVKKEMSFGNKVGTIMQEAQQYINTIGNGLNQILSSVWDAADAEFEYEMRKMEEAISQYEEQLQKQEDITQKHLDAVNGIEDELKTSRGDRRQQLIDNLNAEMAAQRASLAEEKRIEREKKRLEQQKEKEEEEQRKKEHDRAVVQAIISAALAAANGYATQPFIPLGLAMGTLATALGAAQVAIIKSQKYAEGGVIEGKSHAQGGVKVLGGRAEVEGGEFITNKITTTKNVELLEFVNSKKRHISLDDMVEFYGSKGKVAKNVKSFKTKFANGGVVPSLRSDIELNDRLIQSFEDYSNRPVQVAVVDINDAQDNLNRVQVLSGLYND